MKDQEKNYKIFAGILVNWKAIASLLKEEADAWCATKTVEKAKERISGKYL
jgi:hypothetical protein